ncbi:MAG TPA: hypothetical protein VL307_20550 [Chitinophagaceae bacterium]|nr:hypothetical protein [Chitinophagaceae bacterium]
MKTASADIFLRLQQEVLLMQGFKPARQHTGPDAGLGIINNAFPGKTFPLGVLHEFVSSGAPAAAATAGFVAGIVGHVMQEQLPVLWIRRNEQVFPPALQQYGIAPHRVIFIDLQKEKDRLWATEEALHCGALAAVVADIKNLDFMLSRRLQLAVEKSQVTAFILRADIAQLNTTASVTRWQINPLPSSNIDELPGIGHPRWQVNLLKVRHGRPGSWQVEWVNGKCRPVYKRAALIPEQQKKTG